MSSSKFFGEEFLVTQQNGATVDFLQLKVLNSASIRVFVESLFFQNSVVYWAEMVNRILQRKNDC